MPELKSDKFEAALLHPSSTRRTKRGFKRVPNEMPFSPRGVREEPRGGAAIAPAASVSPGAPVRKHATSGASAARRRRENANAKFERDSDHASQLGSTGRLGGSVRAGGRGGRPLVAAFSRMRTLSENCFLLSGARRDAGLPLSRPSRGVRLPGPARAPRLSVGGRVRDSSWANVPLTLAASPPRRCARPRGSGRRGNARPSRRAFRRRASACESPGRGARRSRRARR